MLSLSDYWSQHRQVLQSLSVGVEARPGSSSEVLTYDDGRRGIVDARLWFDEDTFLDVLEEVWIDDQGQPHRESFSYHFQCDGQWRRRWDRDPSQEDPAFEYHINAPDTSAPGGVGHEPSEWISLKTVVDECWDIFANHREYPPL